MKTIKIISFVKIGAAYIVPFYNPHLSMKKTQVVIFKCIELHLNQFFMRVLTLDRNMSRIALYLLCLEGKGHLWNYHSAWLLTDKMQPILSCCKHSLEMKS